ncbi:MAG: family transposase [Herminiimonas sp.]|nr:family transposase [Herminiimonas sp.]
MNSMIVSTKLNGVNPQTCLRNVLTHIAEYPVNMVSDLLPWNCGGPIAAATCLIWCHQLVVDVDDGAGVTLRHQRVAPRDTCLGTLSLA